MQLREEAGRPREEVTTGCLEAGCYYGAVGRRFETPLAVVSKVEHTSARALPLHDHELAYFCMLLGGSYTERVAGRSMDYRIFEAGFHPARMPHRDAVGRDGACFLCLEVHARPGDIPLPRDVSLLPGEVSAQLLHLYRSFAGGTLSGMELEATVWELCGDAARHRTPKERAMPRWMRQCLDIIEEEYADSLTVTAIAERVGVHPVHVSREFRRRYGLTIGEYANKVRVRAACRHLARGGDTLACIAHATGFADHAHFCRVFKSTVGCTPSEFAALRYSM